MDDQLVTTRPVNMRKAFKDSHGDAMPAPDYDHLMLYPYKGGIYAVRKFNEDELETRPFIKVGDETLFFGGEKNTDHAAEGTFNPSWIALQSEQGKTIIHHTARMNFAKMDEFENDIKNLIAADYVETHLGTDTYAALEADLLALEAAKAPAHGTQRSGLSAAFKPAVDPASAPQGKTSSHTPSPTGAGYENPEVS